MQKTQSDVQAEQNTGLLGLEHNVTHQNYLLSRKKCIIAGKNYLVWKNIKTTYKRNRTRLLRSNSQYSEKRCCLLLWCPHQLCAAGSHRSLSSSQKMPPPPSFADNTSTEYDLDSLMNSVFDDIDSQLFNPEIDSGVCPTQGPRVIKLPSVPTLLLVTSIRFRRLILQRITSLAIFPAHAPGQSCSTPTGNDNHFFSSTQQSTIEDSLSLNSCKSGRPWKLLKRIPKVQSP